METEHALTHRIVSSCRFLDLHFSFVVQTKPQSLPDTLVQIITLTSTTSKLVTASPSWELTRISAAFMHRKLDTVALFLHQQPFEPLDPLLIIGKCLIALHASFLSVAWTSAWNGLAEKKQHVLFYSLKSHFLSSATTIITVYWLFPVFWNVQIITEQETGAELAMFRNPVDE